MSILRENIVYAILALVAIILIGVTIGLQLVIITGQNPTVVTGAEQQTQDNQGQQIAFAVATVTETPAVLIIQPAPANNSQAASLQDNQTALAEVVNVESTPTEAALAAPPAVEQPVVEQPVAATATEVILPTPLASPTPEPVAAVAAPEIVQPAPVDSGAFRIGFTSSWRECTTVSQIVKRILDERMAIATTLINYDSVENMFLAVANNEVDMTLCYLDPDNRALLRGENKRKIGFKMVQLGSHYWQNGAQKLQMWVNLPIMSELRMPESTCLLNFFYALQLTEPDLAAIQIDAWLANHDAEITEWVTCQS